MSASTLISPEEYLATSYDPDCDYVDGELVERNVGELDHSGLQGIIFAMLYNQRRKVGIYVFPELRVQVSPTRYRIPDLTVITHKCKGRILREPPFLCIEILSPEDRMSRMETKIDDYLAFGVKYIWVIDPASKTAWTYTSEGKRESTLVLATRNPDITLSLDELFAELRENVEN